MDALTINVLITVLLPLLGSFLAPIIEHYIKENIHYYAIGVAIGAFITATTAFILGIGSTGPVIWTFKWMPALNINGGIYLDHFSLLMLLLVSFVAMLIVLFSHNYMHGDESLGRYYFFILFFIGNMLGLITSDNMLQMFIFWEGVGICSYALIGFWNKDNENVKSGNKAFLVTKAGDVGLLAAIILIYLNVGTLNYSEFTNADFGGVLGQAHLIVLVGVLILSGVVGKSAQFPLQFWLPEAMAGPSTVSALIHAATMVKAGVYLTGRFLPFFVSAAPTYEHQLHILFTIIASVGVFTAFFAGSIGMAAREFKKILAFSTISQLGYMIMGIGVAGLLLDTKLAFFAAVFHMTSHMAFKALLFLGAGAVLHAVHTTKDIFEMGGIGKYMPKTAIIFTIGGLSLSAIPPFAGYFSKESLFEYLIEYSKESSWGIVFLIFAAVTAIFTFFYTLRMIGSVFTGEPSEHVLKAKEEGHLHDPDFYMLFPLASLAVFSTLWGFFGGWLGDWMSYSTVTLAGGFQWMGKIFGSWIGWLILLTVVVVGGIPGYLFYFRRKSNKIFSQSFLQKFLYNRWYWNTLMLKAFVDGSIFAGKGLNVAEKYVDLGTTGIAKGTLAVAEATKVVDEKVVDGAYNGIAKSFQKVSQYLQKLETGKISQYIWVGVLGFAMLLLLVLLLIFL